MKRLLLLFSFCFLTTIARSQTAYVGTPPPMALYVSADGTGLTWNPLAAAAGTAPYNGVPQAFAVYYSSTGTNAGPWYPCTLALCFTGATGTVTSVSGTANQISVASGTTTPVISITTPFTFPGEATFAASLAGAGSYILPDGTAPTTPATKEHWSQGGYDCYFTGTQRICGIGTDPTLAAIVPGVPATPTGSHTVGPSQYMIDGSQIPLPIGANLISNIAITSNVLTVTLTTNNFSNGYTPSFSSVATATFLNSTSCAGPIYNSTTGANGTFSCTYTHADYPSAADTGTVSVSDFGARLLASINYAQTVNATMRTTIDMSNFYALQTPVSDPFSTLPTSGNCPLIIKMPAVALQNKVSWRRDICSDLVIQGRGQGGGSILQAVSGYQGELETVTPYNFGAGYTASVAVSAANCSLSGGTLVSGVADTCLAGTNSSGQVIFQISGHGYYSGTAGVPTVTLSNLGTPTTAAVITLGTPQITIGDCSQPATASVFYSRQENWRETNGGTATNNQGFNLGTIYALCGAQEGSGATKVNFIGDNETSRTSDLVSCIGCANATFEDNEYNATGPNYALGLAPTANGGYQGFKSERTTGNDTAYTNKGIGCVDYAPSPFGSNGVSDDHHCEGFNSALDEEANNNIGSNHIDMTSATQQFGVFVPAGSGTYGSHYLSVSDNVTYTATSGTITNVAITSNVLTITLSTNNFTVGQVAQFTGVGTATFLNGTQCDGRITASTAGASGTFTCHYTHGNYASTADTGTAQTFIALIDDCTFNAPTCRVITPTMVTGTGSYGALSGYFKGMLSAGGLNLANSIQTGAHTLNYHENLIVVTTCATQSIPHAFTGDYWASLYNNCGSTLTVQADNSPTGLINGATSITLQNGQFLENIWADGTNVYGGPDWWWLFKSVTSLVGNGTKLPTAGTIAGTSQFICTDNAGNLTLTTSNCPASGTGTVNTGTQYQLGYYPNSGSAAVVGGDPQITTDAANDLIVTTATTNAVANSPLFQLFGEYQNSGTPTFATTGFQISNVIGSGTNGSETLTIVPVSGGTTGAKLISLGTAATSVTTQLNNTLQQVAGTNQMTIEGGQSGANNSAIGKLTVRGGNQTGAGAAGSQGGPLLLAGGSNAGTNTASVGGTAELLAGASTGATPGLQGLLLTVQSYAQSGTVTQWNLECFTSTAMTVTDCGASPTNIVGVALSKSGSVQVSVVQPGSEVAINASAAVTIGDTVCAGTTAGKVTDSGGTGACTTGLTVGTVVATTGTWAAFPDGTAFPTLSTTLPLVRLTSVAQNTGGTITAGTISAAAFNTATNCQNGASPAVCGSAAAGSVAMPTGTNPTLQVNTTAVTANSQIFLTVDDSVTIGGTTCNSTLATLVGGMAITARTAGSNFTISYNGTIAVNPVCVSYEIRN